MGIITENNGERYYDMDPPSDTQVRCDMAAAGKCDGEACHHNHDDWHQYNDCECFHSCNWPGKTGFCVVGV